MNTLVLDNIDDALVGKLHARARRHGRSDEKEAVRILSSALSDEEGQSQEASSPPKMSFAEFLLHGGPPWPDDFEIPRSKDTNESRQIEF